MTAWTLEWVERQFLNAPLGNRARSRRLAGQQAWARPMQRPGRRKSHGRGKESNHARQPRPQRESSRWAREAVAAKDSAGSTGQLIYVADRESDLYEVFLACEAAKLQRVIRLRHSRVLAGEDLEHPYLKDAAAAVRGHYTLDLPGQKRQAKLEVRSTQVQLRGPIRPGESWRTSDATWCV